MMKNVLAKPYMYWVQTGSFLLMLLTFMACKQENSTAKRSTNSSVIDHTEPLIDHPIDSEEYLGLEADLFGDFYNNRVSFFTEDNPNVEIYGVFPEEVVLYYIDDELFQKKYKLPSDITHDLITVNGKFKIRGLNARNAYFIKRLKSRILFGSEIVSLINFYQLRWEKEENEILYQVRRDTIKTSYTYIERIRGYQEVLKRVKSAESD